MNEDWLDHHQRFNVTTHEKKKWEKETKVVDELTFESLKRHKRDIQESLEAIRKLLDLFPQCYTTRQQLAVLVTKVDRLELPNKGVNHDKLQTTPQG